MNSHKVITMFYELKDATTGEILESNLNAKPMMFITGKEQILKKLEDEIVLLNINDAKIIKISAKDGIGEYDKDAIQILPKEQFAGVELVVGMELFGQSEDGQTARVIVKNIGEDEVTIDFNHPYAGKDLEFNVKIEDSREATPDEVETGVPAGSGGCGCGNKSKQDKDDHECCGGHNHKHDHNHNGHKCCGGHGHHHDHEDNNCGCKH